MSGKLIKINIVFVSITSNEVHYKHNTGVHRPVFNPGISEVNIMLVCHVSIENIT